MKSPTVLGFALAISIPLLAQQRPLTTHQVGAYRGDEEAVRLVTDYCDATDDDSEQRQPKIFAESTSTTEGHIQWRQFSGRDEWEAVRRPTPLVFVWDKNNTTVRVIVVSNPPHALKPVGAYRRTEYCYSTDGILIRIRALWYVPTTCEFLFPCRLIDGNGFLRGQRPAITDWVFTPDGQIRKLRDGKIQDDYFDPSQSLTANDLHLRTSDQLPFNHPDQPR